MANVWIQNSGVYSLSDGKVQDLLSWLDSQGAVNVEGAQQTQVGDKTLLNETGTGAGVGNPNVQIGSQAPPDNPKGANVTNPKSKPGTDYDFGGTWF